MPRYHELYQWFEQIKHNLTCLSLPELHGLMLWCAAIVMGGICSLSFAELSLHSWAGQPLNTIRQRAREFYKDGEHKSGRNRHDLDVRKCFAPLLRWVVNSMPGRQIALAMDASAFKDRFVLLSISVVIGGCAIPVAWRVLPANKKGAWEPHWRDLFDSLKDVIGPDRFVIVMADRGLYARWLYQKIVELGWHPYLRINTRGGFVPINGSGGGLGSFIPQVGCVYKSAGMAFSENRRLKCTLLIIHVPEHDPLLVLTDLPPDQGDPTWYLMRFWIERQFKTLKSAAMQIQHTRMKDSDRLERMLLPAAVALIYEISSGCQLESEQPPDYNLAKAQRSRPNGAKGRRHSLARLGATSCRVMMFGGIKPPKIKLMPEQWPDYIIFCRST